MFSQFTWVGTNSLKSHKFLAFGLELVQPFLNRVFLLSRTGEKITHTWKNFFHRKSQKKVTHIKHYEDNIQFPIHSCFWLVSKWITYEYFVIIQQMNPIKKYHESFWSYQAVNGRCHAFISQSLLTRWSGGHQNCHFVIQCAADRLSKYICIWQPMNLKVFSVLFLTNILQQFKFILATKEDKLQHFMSDPEIYI